MTQVMALYFLNIKYMFLLKTIQKQKPGHLRMTTLKENVSEKNYHGQVQTIFCTFKRTDAPYNSIVEWILKIFNDALKHKTYLYKWNTMFQTWKSSCVMLKYL